MAKSSILKVIDNKTVRGVTAPVKDNTDKRLAEADKDKSWIPFKTVRRKLIKHGK